MFRWDRDFGITSKCRQPAGLYSLWNLCISVLLTLFGNSSPYPNAGKLYHMGVGISNYKNLGANMGRCPCGSPSVAAVPVVRATLLYRMAVIASVSLWRPTGLFVFFLAYSIAISFRLISLWKCSGWSRSSGFVFDRVSSWGISIPKSPWYIFG